MQGLPFVAACSVRTCTVLGGLCHCKVQTTGVLRILLAGSPVLVDLDKAPVGLQTSCNGLCRRGAGTVHDSCREPVSPGRLLARKYM